MKDRTRQHNELRASYSADPNSDASTRKTDCGKLPPLPSRPPVGNQLPAQLCPHQDNNRSADVAVLERVAAAIRALPLEPDPRNLAADHHDTIRLQCEIDRVIERWHETHSNEAHRDR